MLEQEHHHFAISAEHSPMKRGVTVFIELIEVGAFFKDARKLRNVSPKNSLVQWIHACVGLTICRSAASGDIGGHSTLIFPPLGGCSGC